MKNRMSRNVVFIKLLVLALIFVVSVSMLALPSSTLLSRTTRFMISNKLHNCRHYPTRINSKLFASSNDDSISSASVLEYVEYTYSSTEPNQTDGSPVILLHGLLGSKRNFSSIGSALSRQLVKKKRRVLALDLRNHGESKVEHWRESMSYSEMAGDVLGFLDSMGFGKAVLVGHSMGGKVAQALALLYPERVEGLIVLDIAPVVYDREKDGSWRAVSNVIDALTTLPTENTSERELDFLLKENGVDDVALRSFVLTNVEENRHNGKIR